MLPYSRFILLAVHRAVRCAVLCAVHTQGLQYLDSADGRLEKAEGGEAVTFDGGEVDRIYVGAPDELTVGIACKQVLASALGYVGAPDELTVGIT